MIFKSLNKYLFFLLFFLLFSCKGIDIFTTKNIKNIEYNEKKENFSIIDINNIDLTFYDTEDYYDQLILSNWINKNKFIKLFSFNSFGKKYIESKPLNSFIFKNQIISFAHDSIIYIYNLSDFKLSNKIELKTNLNLQKSYPTSLARISNNFYVTYSDGNIINFNLEGKILWIKKFQDIIKTPIKIYNDNLIIVLSDSIISINSLTSEINWEFKYTNDVASNALGGNLIDLNHLILFVLPNNKIGEIDTIFREKNNSLFTNYFYEKSINNSSLKIHSYNNILSYLDQNKFLSTIDYGQATFLLNRAEILNVHSATFFNNTLVTFNKDSKLKAYNIFNKKLFWELDLLNIVNLNDEIIKISNFSKSLILFFKSGNILQINSLNGDIISHKNLKINNIINVTYNDKYYLVYQNNGKVTLFSQ